jgi:hypothetical protein
VHASAAAVPLRRRIDARETENSGPADAHSRSGYGARSPKTGSARGTVPVNRLAASKPAEDASQPLRILPARIFALPVAMAARIIA